MTAERPFTRFIAIDWSGAESSRVQRQTIVSCVVERADGRPRVTSLEGCRDRNEVVAWLAERAGDEVRTLVGLDFPFSYAAPFLDCLPAPNFRALLDYARRVKKPAEIRAHVDRCGSWWAECGACGDHRTLRHVERLPRTRGVESPLRALRGKNDRFDFVGARQVGKAAITGIAAIAELKRKTRSVRVWPFEDLAGASLVLAEIWPRLALTKRRVVKSDCVSRRDYVTNLEQEDGIRLEPEHRGLALGSDHAIDALAAGIEMASGRWPVLDVAELPEEVRREGWILGVAP